MSPDPKDDPDPLLTLTASVMASYVANHSVEPDALPGLAKTIYASLVQAGDETGTSPSRAPAVPIAESITDSHLICLEDGQRFQSLKRHLRVAFGLSPQQYRRKWGLPDDYPMVSPAYARRRSELARKSRLGKNT